MNDLEPIMGLIRYGFETCTGEQGDRV